MSIATVTIARRDNPTISRFAEAVWGEMFKHQIESVQLGTPENPDQFRFYRDPFGPNFVLDFIDPVSGDRDPDKKPWVSSNPVVLLKLIISARMESITQAMIEYDKDEFDEE